MKDKKKKSKNISTAILSIIKPTWLKNISRPKDIPPIVHDCGWNHGEGNNEKRS
jgi:hypothetical protein